MSNVYFTSDLHFGHANVIKYSRRPFADVTEMREALITRWNAVVKPGDTVYVLGDMFFCDAVEAMAIMDRLNGQKWLIYGNHDSTVKHSKELQAKFVKCVSYHELSVRTSDPRANRGQWNFVLSHYAHLHWNRGHHGAFMLHGHSHGGLKYPYDNRIMDVGVDCHGYAPISMDAVIAKLISKPYAVHHGD